jgi:hypothetical protein
MQARLILAPAYPCLAGKSDLVIVSEPSRDPFAPKLTVSSWPTVDRLPDTAAVKLAPKPVGLQTKHCA